MSIQVRRSPSGNRVAFRPADLKVTESMYGWFDTDGGRYTEEEVEDWIPLVSVDLLNKALDISINLTNLLTAANQKLTAVRQLQKRLESAVTYNHDSQGYDYVIGRRDAAEDLLDILGDEK